tara:strand:+ start:11321 stop:11749 length:429 start_codon:yes stop_codon:yes gene_type:complete
MLPQYKNRKDPVFHKFVAFSILDDSDNVIHKICQCNSCGVLHNVIDLCRSEIVRGAEESASIVTIDDLRFSLPKDIGSVLDSHKCDLPTWEYVKFVYDTERWGEIVVISKEELDDFTHIKLMKIISENKINIESRTRKNTLL